MSKRARALMDTMTPIIIRALHGFDDAPEADAKIEALLDDFARKVRERCAERASEWWLADINLIGAGAIARMKAAILADEED